MVQTVEAPDGQMHEFPDEATPEQIKKALSGNKQMTPDMIPGMQPSQVQQPQQQQSPQMANTFVGKMPMPQSGGMQPNEKDLNTMAMMAIPGASFMRPLMRGAESLPGVGNAIASLRSGLAENHPILNKLLQSLGTGAEGAAIGAAATPEDRKSGALSGFALGAGGRGLYEGGKSTIDALRPSNLFKGNASPRELARNVESAAGTKTSLGDIVSNPLMKQFYENFLAKLPLSGAHQKLAETGTGIVNRGQNMIDSYLPKGIAPEQVSDRLGKSLVEAKKSAQQTKINAYESANNLAERDNLKLELPKFSEAANKHIDSIENTTMLQHEPEVKSILNKLKNYRNPTQTTITQGKLVNKEGKPLISESVTKYPSLREANILAGKLNDLADEYSASVHASDRGAGRTLGELGRALKDDIRGAIKQNGSLQLQKEFSRAEKFYSQSYHPFLDKDLIKFTNEQKPPEDLIATFLRNSKTSDKSQHLNKLMDKLSPQDQDLVRYGYFSRAMHGPEGERVVNPNKLRTLWENLGSNQKKILMPNKLQRRQFDNFSNLTQKNQEALNLMYNPKTGHRGLINLMWKAPIGGLMRPVVNKLTDETYRAKIVNKMIENAGKEK